VGLPGPGAPAIGHVAKPGIERRSQFRDRLRKRIRKVFVFAAPEAVASHHDRAAEMCVIGIERGDRAAFVRREQTLQHAAALRVEIVRDTRPVDRIDAGGDARGWNFASGDFCGALHRNSLAARAAAGHPISGDCRVIARSAGDEAIQFLPGARLDCFASLAMTTGGGSPTPARAARSHHRRGGWCVSARGLPARIRSGRRDGCRPWPQTYRRTSRNRRAICRLRNRA